MAIKVLSTTVIDDSRVLQNIAGANGRYDDFHPNVSAITTAIDFSKPVMTRVLSSNVTFSEVNKGAGKIGTLLLDTSASAFTPTFSANVGWSADTEPTWSDHRYWNISLVCWDSTDVRATAVGFDA